MMIKLKKLLALLVGVALFASCNTEVEQQHQTKQNEIAPIPTVVHELMAIEKNGKSFYDWYFKNDFPNCEIVKDKNGFCRLDTLSYFKTLRGLGTLSEKFINKEKLRLLGCSEYISTVRYAAFDSADAYEYDQYCLDIYYMYWIKSQEPPESFSVREARKINELEASLEIYDSYGGEDVPLSKVLLEKELGSWRIVEIKFINRDEPVAEKVDIFGKWYNELVVLNIHEKDLDFIYHGQCAYFYPIAKLSDDCYEMIWSREMDCKFDNGTNNKFGLDKAPEVGKPFSKLKLQNNVLYVEYYYKEWVEAYKKKIQADVFTGKYFRRME